MGGDPPAAPALMTDDELFSELYRERYRPMVRLAVLLVSRLDVAEELVQDSFAALFGHWSTIDDPGAYLRKAVVNKCHDTLRRQRLGHKERWLQGPEVVQPIDHLGDVIAALPPRNRAVVVLRFYESMTIDEIATTLGVRPGTIKSQLHRALHRLRKELEP